MKSSGFLNDIHYFRGLSIVLIASSHLLFTDVNSIFYKVVSAVFLNSTMFFAFISGFLFQYLLKSYKYPDYLKRKFFFVILPYILISIPAIVLRFKTGPSYLALLNNPNLDSYNSWQQIIYYYLTGAHQLPLWYLPMVTIFFFLAPLFKYLDDHPKLYWSLPFCFIITLLLPRGDLSQLNNIPRMFGHFLFIYIFGMFVSRYKPLVQRFTRRNLTLIIILLSCFFFLSIFDGFYRHQIIFIQKCLAILVVLFFLQSVKGKTLKAGFNQLAITSFGIYFIHFYVIQAFRKISSYFGFSEYPANQLIWFFQLILVLIVSYIFVVLTRSIFKKSSRYLIGS